MSETVSTRLPSQLIRMLEEEARARGISISMLLREVIEQRYGVKSNEKEAQKPFLVLLEEALRVQGESKMKACPRFESSRPSCAVYANSTATRSGLSLHQTTVRCKHAKAFKPGYVFTGRIQTVSTFTKSSRALVMNQCTSVNM